MLQYCIINRAIYATSSFKNIMYDKSQIQILIFGTFAHHIKVMSDFGPHVDGLLFFSTSPERHILKNLNNGTVAKGIMQGLE